MSEPKPIGRPTKLTPEVREKILVAIRKGAPYQLACDYARIDVSTFCKWRIRAEVDKDPLFVEFFDDLKEAEGHTSLIWLDVIDKAMKDGQWTAAAWKLERRHYKYFSNQAAMIEMNERLNKLEGTPNEKRQHTESDQEDD